MKRLILLLLPLFLFSCVPPRFDLPVRTKVVVDELPPSAADSPITVINLYEQLPDNSRFLRKVAIGGNSFFNCTACNYELVIGEAEFQARQHGANIVKVIKPLGLRLGACPRVTFGFFRNDDPAAMAAYQERHETGNASSLPPGADYAVIHFYRPAFSSSSILAYPVVYEKTRIGRLGNNRKFTFQTTKFGPQRFFAGNSPLVLELDVQPGQEYYVSYMPTAGMETEIPGLRLVDNIVGREETKTLKPFIPRAARSSR